MPTRGGDALNGEKRRKTTVMTRGEKRGMVECKTVAKGGDRE